MIVTVPRLRNSDCCVQDTVAGCARQIGPKGQREFLEAPTFQVETPFYVSLEYYV